MAADWRKLIADKPAEMIKAFKKRAGGKTETQKRREKLIAGINNVLKQLQAKTANPPRGWYSTVRNENTEQDWIKASLRVGNKTMPVAGNAFNLLTPETAPDFYRGILAEVEAGDWDEQIDAVAAGKAQGATGKRADAGKKRGPLSPEALEARRAKMAAKHK